MMPDSMEKWLGPLIKKTYRNMTNLHDQKLSTYGLSTSQVSVLSQLWHQDGQTQKELVKKLGIRPASLSNIVDKMEQKGWVIRKLDAEDSRYKRIFLTKEGKVLEETCLKVVLEMEELLSKGFTQEELTVLILWLKRLNQNVGHTD